MSEVSQVNFKEISEYVQTPRDVYSQYNRLEEVFSNRIRFIDFIPCEELPNSNDEMTLPEYVRSTLVPLGSPHGKISAIHVTGTNGKGSVTTKVTFGLVADGYTVVTIMSPHIHEYRERILINGKPIEKKKMVELACLVLASLHDSGHALGMVGVIANVFFLCAEKKMRRAKKFMAVIEGGIGGLDHVAAIQKTVIATFTSIGLDHQKWLGSSREKIAENKANIIRKGCEVVVGPKIPLQCLFKINEKASDEGCPVTIVPWQKGQDFEERNSETARWTLKRLGVGLSGIEKGLKHVPIGRHHRISLKKKGFANRIVLDAAHNAHGLGAIGEWLEGHTTQQWAFLFGLALDKDLDACADELQKMNERLEKVYLLDLSLGLRSNDEIGDALLKRGIPYEKVKRGSIQEELSYIAEETSRNEWRFVTTGSFKMIATITRALGIHELYSFPNVNVDTPKSKESISVPVARRLPFVLLSSSSSEEEIRKSKRRKI